VIAGTWLKAQAVPARRSSCRAPMGPSRKAPSTLATKIATRHTRRREQRSFRAHRQRGRPTTPGPVGQRLCRARAAPLRSVPFRRWPTAKGSGSRASLGARWDSRGPIWAGMLGTPRTTRQPRSPTRPPATARPVPASRRGNTSTFPNQSELSPTPTVVRVEPQQHQRRVLKAAQLSRPAVCASAIASWGGPPCRGRTSRLDEPPDPQAGLPQL